MSKRAKRLAAARQNPKTVTVDQLDQLMKDFGFVKRSGKGSHTIYQHPSQATPVVVAAHGQHVPVYIVKQVLDAINRLPVGEGDSDADKDD